jgi:hypothetical protein
VNYFEQLEQSHYGSMELKRTVGPNMLKGLAVSLGVHALVVLSFFVVIALQKKPVPKETVRVVDISQLTKLVAQPETPQPLQIGSPRLTRSRAMAPPSATLPTFLPGEITLTPYELPATNLLSKDEPQYSVSVPQVTDPFPQYQASDVEPSAAALPNFAGNENSSSNYYPPTNLPSPQTRGGLQTIPGGGGGNIGGPPSDLPGYGGTGGTGRGDGSGTGDAGYGPLGELPGYGTGGNGASVNSTAKVPGVGGEGERYTASSQQIAPSSESAKPKLENIFVEPELSGLLKWIRARNSRFPEVVRTYMETHPADLCGITSYGGWDIFIQFSEDAHQLKIFLTKGAVGILLADSDFKSRSQLFGSGRVSRGQSGITSIESVREKPTIERTNEFYHVFQDWLDTQNIQMGSRRAQ